MIAFIIAALGLLLLIGVIILWVTRRQKQVTDNHRELNTAVYRDQLQELNAERQAGSISEEDYQTANLEIQRRLLEEADDDASLKDVSVGRRWVWVALVMLPVLSVSFYLWRGHLEVFKPENTPMSDQQIGAMVEGLAAKLAQNPNDPKGWAMLGRSYMSLNRPQDAVNAFAHIENSMNEDANLLADYAEAWVASGADKGFKHSQELVTKALKLEPGNAKGLYLQGGFDFAQGDFKGAEESWKKLMPLVDPSSPDAKFVLDSINQARVKEHLPALTLNDFQGSEGPVTTPEVLASGGDVQASAVSGVVSLDAKLKDRVSPQDVVFLFARATHGPRMPLAVLRLTVAQLPYQFKLTKDMAMSPNFNLSTVSEVTVEAKISKSGTATPQAGDWLGMSAPVKPGTQGVKVVIDHPNP